MKYCILSLFCFLIIACNNDKKDNFRAENEAEIEKYLEENNLTAQKSSSGLYYIIQSAGTGNQPTASSNVTVAYKGYYTNKSVFDESGPEGISFGLQQVIAGWTEGITYFKEGGRGILLVPSHLGYGSNDNRGIPGGSVLIFEVNLISVN